MWRDEKSKPETLLTSSYYRQKAQYLSSFQDFVAQRLPVKTVLVSHPRREAFKELRTSRWSCTPAEIWKRGGGTVEKVQGHSKSCFQGRTESRLLPWPKLLHHFTFMSFSGICGTLLIAASNPVLADRCPSVSGFYQQFVYVRLWSWEDGWGKPGTFRGWQSCVPLH